MTWPRAVVFDLDGTLIDSAPDLARSLNIVLTERGRAEVSLDRVKGFIGDGGAKLVERGLAATGGASKEEVGSAFRRFLEVYEAEPAVLTRPYPGVEETLALLQAAGTPLAICTNKPRVATHAVLAALSLDRYFGAVVGGDSLPVRKPDPAPLRAALRGIGAEAGSAVMVGDNEHDSATATAAGVPCVLVSYGYARMPLASIPAVATAERFGDLPGIFARLAAAR